MHYKVIAFDFDGTLADSMALFLEAMKTASARHGVPDLPIDELDQLRAMDSEQLMRHLGIPAWKVPVIASTMRRLMARGAQSVQLFPGVVEMLTALKALDKRVAIATSSTKANVKMVLGDEALSQIDFMECGASLFGKHAKLLNIVRAAKVRPKDVLYIGDELRDADAAAAAKVDFAGVAWGYALPVVLQKRSVISVFTSPQEVVAFCAHSPVS